MMRKLIFVGIVVLAMSSLALAQDYKKSEIFGGYSYLRSDVNPDMFIGSSYDSTGQGGAGNLNGWEASYTYNVNSWLGIKADISGHYGENEVDYDYSYMSERYDEYSGYYDTYRESYSSHGKVDVTQYYYLFGPEFSYRGNPKIRPFAHVLFGWSKTDGKNLSVDWTNEYGYDNGYNYRYLGNMTGSFSDTSFAMALGGGLDINVNDRVAIRLAQIDYIPSFAAFNAETTNTYDEYYYDTYEYTYIETETIKVPRTRFNNLRLSTGIKISF